MEPTTFPGRNADLSVEILELSPSPMVLVNSSSYRIVGVNAAAAALLGAEQADLMDKELSSVLAFNFDNESLNGDTTIGHGVAYLWGSGAQLRSLHLDYRILGDDAGYILIALFDGARVSTAMREELEAARTDATTGALRRDSFLQILDSYGQHPSQPTYGVLFLDIDNFKRFNDMFGHQFGDRVLAKVVEVLRAMLRSSDIIGRFGGDEFVVLLSGPLNYEDIDRIARHVERRVATAVSSRVGTDVQASVGAAYCTAHTTANQAVRAADAAMYGAKRRKPGEPAVAVVAADRACANLESSSSELLVT